MNFKNKKIGSLTLISIVNNAEYRLTTRAKSWICRCNKCGGTAILTGTDLKEAEKDERKAHCGCVRKDKSTEKTLIGLKFFNVTPVIRTIPTSYQSNLSSKVTTYFCRCDCGETLNVTAASLLISRGKLCNKCAF